jgi:hypothetical protein
MLLNSFKIIAYVCKDANTFGIKKNNMKVSFLRDISLIRCSQLPGKNGKKTVCTFFVWLIIVDKSVKEHINIFLPSA